ncbi:MAG: CvpA family protein [Candidatus Adiutrix sp.]|nr:CvpA family protein [Candidatus Adiutrix sp.]
MDIALMVIMGYFFLRGIFRGVVKEVVTVLGLFVSFWVASVYYPLGAVHLASIFEMESHRNIASFFFVFMVVYFLLSVLSIFVDKIVKLTISPVISALLGSVVGILKGALFCAIVLVVAQFFVKPTDKFFTNSNLWPVIQPVANQAQAWMPEAIRIIKNTTRNIAAGLPGAPARPAASPNTAAPALAPTLLDQVDWKTIQDILTNRPEVITPAWRDKLRNMPNPSALTNEDVRRFIEDHRDLFNSILQSTNPGAAAPAQATTAAPAAPSWPQPAAE